MKKFLTGLLIIGILIIGAALIQATNLGQKIANFSIEPSSQLAAKNYNSSKSNSTEIDQQIKNYVGNVLRANSVSEENIVVVRDALQQGISEEELRALLEGIGVEEDNIQGLFQRLDELGITSEVDVAKEEIESDLIRYITPKSVEEALDYLNPYYEDYTPGAGLALKDRGQDEASLRLQTILNYFDLEGIMQAQQFLGVPEENQDGFAGPATWNLFRDFWSSFEMAMEDFPDETVSVAIIHPSLNYYTLFNSGTGYFEGTSPENVAILLVPSERAVSTPEVTASLGIDSLVSAYEEWRSVTSDSNERNAFERLFESLLSELDPSSSISLINSQCVLPAMVLQDAYDAYADPKDPDYLDTTTLSQAVTDFLNNNICTACQDEIKELSVATGGEILGVGSNLFSCFAIEGYGGITSLPPIRSGLLQVGP